MHKVLLELRVPKVMMAVPVLRVPKVQEGTMLELNITTLQLLGKQHSRQPILLERMLTYM